MPSTPLMVPIRSLGPSYRERITAHLLKLEPADRYLRFGYAANDEQIRRYAEQLDFDRDEIFGIYNRRLELIAMAHLAFTDHPEYVAMFRKGIARLRPLTARIVLYASQDDYALDLSRRLFGGAEGPVHTHTQETYVAVDSAIITAAVLSLIAARSASWSPQTCTHSPQPLQRSET